MTKSQLIETLSEELKHLSKSEVEIIVETVFGKMKEALKKKNRVELRGFGIFEVRHRPSRQGRNPKSGAPVYVQNRYVPFFKVGKELKERVNNSVTSETTSSAQSTVTPEASATHASADYSIAV